MSPPQLRVCWTPPAAAAEGQQGGCTGYSQVAPVLRPLVLAVSLVKRTVVVGLGQPGVGLGALLLEEVFSESPSLWSFQW